MILCKLFYVKSWEILTEMMPTGRFAVFAHRQAIDNPDNDHLFRSLGKGSSRVPSGERSYLQEATNR